MLTLKPYNQLSEEKKKLINTCINTDDNIFLEGPPWSGKSLTCMYGLRNVIENKNASALFMVSNNAMYGFMSMSLRELGIDGLVDIDTKNKLFWKMAKDKRLSVNLDADYHENYDSILTNLLNEDIDKRYDLIIVNEVQDYLPKEWEMIKLISKRVVCYGDFNQAIYSNKVSRDTIMKDCVYKQLDYLSDDIATNKLIKIRDCFFGDNAAVKAMCEGGESLIENKDDYSMGEGYSFIDVEYENEFKAIANKIKDLRVENSRVAIVCPNNNKFAELSIYLENHDVEHRYYEINEDLREHDFTSTTPLFLSIFNAEGLQFDNVILFGFDKSNYIIQMKRRENKLKNILYVGMTRARNTTYIIRTMNTVKELMDLKD